MAYFPAYINLDNKKILIVGGGNIAYEKLQKLIDFTDNITILSLEFLDEVINLAKRYNLTTIKRGYKKGDILGYDIVIVATNTISLHKEIFLEARDTRVLVNSVDDTRYCDFIFPSYIKRGDLIVSFSTSGASPAFAKYIRRYFEKLIPQNTADFLTMMRELRDTLPKGKERMKKFDQMAKRFIEDNFK